MIKTHLHCCTHLAQPRQLQQGKVECGLGTRVDWRWHTLMHILRLLLSRKLSTEHTPSPEMTLTSAGKRMHRYCARTQQRTTPEANTAM